MSKSADILIAFLTSKARYKGLSYFFATLNTSRRKRKNIRNALAYFKRRQYVSVEADTIRVTENGKRYIKRRQTLLRMFCSPFASNATKNLLLIFDIPEPRKGEREWFRRQLKIFDYVMIQKSVWVGPSPLPKEFMAYIKSIKLNDGIKMFKLARGQRIKTT